MSFVLDASVALTWCFEEEKTRYTEDILDRLQITEAHVPAIWPMEMSNAILSGERRNRISIMHALRFLQLLQTVRITIDQEGSVRSLEPVLVLGRLYNLTAYDASYLELATRLGLPLATLDDRLKTAATKADISLA